jgi:hypothetical protein
MVRNDEYTYILPLEPSIKNKGISVYSIVLLYLYINERFDKVYLRNKVSNILV